jgi:arsenate reductase-like glutaredoxin family protein
MTKLQQMIEETKRQAEEKGQQARQLEQQLQQMQQGFQQLVNEHNTLIIRLNTLTEIEAAGEGLTAEVVEDADKPSEVEENNATESS